VDGRLASVKPGASPRVGELRDLVAGGLVTRRRIRLGQQPGQVLVASEDPVPVPAPCGFVDAIRARCVRAMRLAAAAPSHGRSRPQAAA